MTRFIHDQFAKDYLEELLKNYGEVKPSEKLSSEIKEIDICFIPKNQPNPNLEILGLLGEFTASPAILEPFRNPASSDEICDCIVKVLETKAKLRREAKTNKTKLQPEIIPKLWVLTPTASATVLSSFNANPKEEFSPGVYFLGDALRTAIVVIHQLPPIPETLWLRILGRGKVQEQAITELQALPLNHPYQQVILELVYSLRENLRINQELDQDDRELIMRLEPLYQRDKAQAIQQGEQRLIMRQLNRRFGEIDPGLGDRVRELSIEQLENLGEALLDFVSVEDLETWLNMQRE
ncbi:DUF4351 domain-containing protein [Calothrix sp. NIES-3974]|uniref:DUF4351 domain-containing protein n=1 Tax=Calothrix sp. NIES-3974 TaxID=2005462 RepID=UPI000B5DF78C|nr:DUF4351 domain-containing protein [Calothrix sp. NIES-3974]BAZ05002.1 hypothetical protein NIES3974_16480 [Calothrix sp. NIES-3974]